MTELAKQRPEYRNIHAFRDLPSYRWPLAALVSGMHRISGMIMFLLLPLVIWMFDTSVSSEISFGKFTSAFSSGLGFAPILDFGGGGDSDGQSSFYGNGNRDFRYNNGGGATVRAENNWWGIAPPPMS